MIVTLTPNPSIDRTVSLTTLGVGRVNRAQDVRQDPGGKGVNVSRALALHAAQTRAVMPLGGPEGAMLRRLLAEVGVGIEACEIEEATRINTTLATKDGTTTKVNEPGPHLTTMQAQGLVDSCCALVGDGDWIVGAGSLPRGVDAAFYARLVAHGHDVGANVAVDSSGTAFARALDAGPDLVKPNHHELGEALGRELRTLGDVVNGARELVASGVETAIVSLGASGALAVTAETALHTSATRVHPRSTVGAGDALLAGFLLAHSRGGALDACLDLGIRFGTAAVGLPGSVMPTPSEVDAITATLSPSIDLDAPVEE